MRVQRILLVFLGFTLSPWLVPWVPVAALEVSGRVVDQGGQALGGAEVVLSPWVEEYLSLRAEWMGGEEGSEDVRVRADVDGVFRVSVSDPGFWKLRVRGEGHLEKLVPLEPLLEDRDLGRVRLSAAKEFPLTVLGTDGKPVKGARVKARNVRRNRWLPKLTTSSQGQVQISTWSDVPEDLAAVEVMVFVPGHPEVRREKVSRDETLQLRPGRTREVEVRDHRGGPVAEALVLVGVGRWPVGVTDKAGRLEVVLEDGVKTPVEVLARDGRRHLGQLAVVVEKERAEKEEVEKEGAEKEEAEKEEAEKEEAEKEDAENDEVNSAPTTPEVIELAPLRTLVGRVVEGLDHRPLGGALVWFDGRLEAAEHTDARGRFRLRVAETPQTEGEHQFVRAAAVGFFVGRQRVAADEEDVEDVVMQPGLALSGRVVDTGGNPIAGAELWASLDPSTLSRRDAHRGGGTTRSDAQGYYRLRWLVPRLTYTVEVRKVGYAPRVEMYTAPSPGEGGEYEVVLEGGRRAWGRVVDTADQPVAGAAVSLFKQEKGQNFLRMMRGHMEHRPLAEAIVDKEGRFVFADLASGRYRLHVKASSFAAVDVPGVEIPGGAEASSLPEEGFDLGVVVLEPGVTLKGRVVDAEGKALPEVFVRGRREGKLFSFSEEDSFRTRTDAEGTFRFDDLQAGDRLFLSARLQGHVEAQLNGVVVPVETPLQLVLKPEAQISGWVRTTNGEPVVGAQISVHQEVRFRDMRHALSDEEGRFTVEGLGAGKVQMEVRAEGYLSTSVPDLQLAVGEHPADLEIVLEQGGLEVRGRVMDADRGPVAEAHLSLQQGDSSSTFVTDKDGYFEGTVERPGVYELGAYHRDFPPVERMVEVKVGQPVEVIFQRGFTVDGQVVNEAGEAVAGASVLLGDVGMYGAGPAGATDREGLFTIEQVPSGTYKIFVEHSDYAPNVPGAVVVVEEEPATGLLLRLGHGTTVTGQISGLEFAEFARLTVLAISPGQSMLTGEVDFEGGYRIPNLGPGIWQVMAQSSGRGVMELVEVPEGTPEIVVDLAFGDGYAVEGRVLRKNQPMDGASLFVRGLGTSTTRSTQTDQQGRYRVEGLKADRYLLEVTEGRNFSLLARREVEVSEDRTFDVILQEGRLRGRIVDAITNEPLAAAMLTAEPVLEAGGIETPRPLNGASDPLGEIDLRLTDGLWSLRVEKEGYGMRQVEVEIPPEGDLTGFELALEPTQGLRLTVSRPGASAVGRVHLALLDEQGLVRAFTTTLTGEDGQVHFAGAPVGRFELLVELEGTAPQRVQVTVPEDSPHLILHPGATLEILAPAVIRQQSTATVRLLDPNGRPFQAFLEGRVASRFPLLRGHVRIEQVPAGVWAVEVTAVDQRSWSQSVTLEAGGQVHLRIE